eukprot:scaffold3103_cov136-Cylindrotheca_fusiformis.AAC.20
MLMKQVVLAVSLFNLRNSLAAEVSCASGWNNEVRVIPADWINDGYCDCPLDGKDEPDTEACSGSSAWPGLSIDPSEEPSLSFSVFQCPQQSKLKLPLSRVNDGICDCCDGVDEPEGTCPDICETVLKEEREARAKLESGFKVGYNKRKHNLYNFKKLRLEKQKEIRILEQELASLQTDDLQNSLDQLKAKYSEERQLLAAKVVKDMDDLVAALKEEELKNLIVHSCQVAGELSERDASTCVPLRLAGLDMGMAWSEDHFGNSDKMDVETGDSIVADLLFDNALNEGSKKWTLKDKNRRRLDEDYYDEDYHGYDYGDEDTDDEFYEPYRSIEDEEEAYTPPVRYRTRGSVDGKEKELIDGLKGMPFCKSRVTFMNRSNELSEKIDKFLTKDVAGEEQGEDEEGGEIESIDPAAYNMVKSTLGQREDAIWKGFKWGASAMLFFEVSPALSSEQLKGLAIGTLIHGDLGAVHVWQILQSIVPELVSVETPSDTCGSPWATSCPPKTITRIKGQSFPPSFIVSAAESFCASGAEMLISDETCASETISADDIPTSVSDGQFGYFLPTPRAVTDALMPFFSPVLSLQPDKAEADSLKKSMSDIEKQRAKIERQITDEWKDIGGKDGDQLGPDGELHSIANECYSVVAGKYTYEVCLFNGAKQKDEGSSTNLGKWTGMEIVDGQRVMKWEGGQKCWNGPQRSATVNVSCGPETKILSADEPETCCYVFEMESHIACDEVYKAKMGMTDDKA